MSHARIPVPEPRWISTLQTRPLMAEGGYFAMAEEPGLGPTLDLARLELEPGTG